MLAVTPEIKRAELAVAEAATLDTNLGLEPLAAAAFGANLISSLIRSTPTGEASPEGAARIDQLAKTLG